MERLEDLRLKYLKANREKLIENMVLQEIEEKVARRMLATEQDKNSKEERETRLLNAQNLLKAYNKMIPVVEEMIEEQRKDMKWSK